MSEQERPTDAQIEQAMGAVRDSLVRTRSPCEFCDHHGYIVVEIAGAPQAVACPECGGVI